MSIEKKSVLEHWIQDVTQTKTRAALDQWTLGEIQKTVRYAKETSPFYQKLLEETVPPGSFRDMASLPFTCPADIIRSPWAFSCISQSRFSRIVTMKTSGTTGAGKRIFFTEEDQRRTVDFFAEGMMDITAPGRKAAVLMPCALDGSIGDLLMKGLKRKNVLSLPLGPVQDIAKTFSIIAENGCTDIVGIPAQVLALAKYQETSPSAVKNKLSIQSALLSADMVTAGTKKAIEKIWNCTVFNHYGLTETGFGGAVECGSLAGCHIRECDLYIEIIDPDTGRLLDNGEIGEIVLTTLRRTGMPLIRYRTGDMGFIDNEDCPCGSYIKRLIPQGGRLKDWITLPNGKALPLIWYLDGALAGCTGVVDFDACYLLDQNHLTLKIYCINTPDEKQAEACISSILRDGGISFQIAYGQTRGFEASGMSKRKLHKKRY